MFIEREKVYITIATLVVPYLKKDVGEFISLLQTGSLEAGRGKRGGLCIKFGNDHAKTRSIGTSFWKDRSLFDFQKTSDGKLLNWKNSDFVTLAVKDGNCFYDFAFFFTEDRIDKIWNDSEKGNRIQLFDVSFETGNQPFQKLKFAEKEMIASTRVMGRGEWIIAVGKVERQYSMAIANYNKITGQNPVHSRAVQLYYSYPREEDRERRKMSFHDFWADERRILGDTSVYG